MKTSEAWRRIEKHFDHYTRTGVVPVNSLADCICIAISAYSSGYYVSDPIPQEIRYKMEKRVRDFMSSIEKSDFKNSSIIYPRNQVYARNRACLCAFFARECEREGD